MGKFQQGIIEFEKDFLNLLKEDKNACVEVQTHRHHIALHPFHLTNFTASVKSILSKRITKYDKKLSGILLGFQKIKLLSPLGAINFDSCFIHVDIEADFFLFKPEVGKQLTGIVNKKSEGHVSCLVHKAFIVAFPKPEESDDWIGDALKIGTEVLFRVTFTDFEGRLPYIRGEFISVLSEVDSGISTSEENSLEKTKKSKNKKTEFDDNFSESETSSKQKKSKKKSKNTLNIEEGRNELSDNTKTENFAETPKKVQYKNKVLINLENTTSKKRNISESSQEDILNDILFNKGRELHLSKSSLSTSHKRKISESSQDEKELNKKRKLEFIEPAIVKKKRLHTSSISSQSDGNENKLHLNEQLKIKKDIPKKRNSVVDELIKKQLIEEQLNELNETLLSDDSTKSKKKKSKQLIKQELGVLMSDDSTKMKHRQKKSKDKSNNTSMDNISVEDMQKRLLEEQLQAISGSPGRKIKIKQEKNDVYEHENIDFNLKEKKLKKIKIKKEKSEANSNEDDDDISLPDLNLEELFKPSIVNISPKINNYQMADEEDRATLKKK